MDTKESGNQVKTSNGTTRDPGPGHFLTLRESFMDAINIINDLHKLSFEIEKEIILISNRLEISQPPASGKLGVRWWVSENGKRQPRVVEWFANRRGRMWPNLITTTRITRKVKRKGGFSVNYNETLECMELLQKIMSMRASVISSMKKVKQIGRGLANQNWPVLNFQKNRGVEIEKRIKQNLIAAGYGVPDLPKE